jgi:hypothetical protein
VIGQVNQAGHGVEIETVHGAGVVAQVLGEQHQRHAHQTQGAHGLVARHPGLAAIILIELGENKILHRLRGRIPVALGFFLPGIEIGAQHEEEGGIRHLGLPPGYFTNGGAQGRVPHLHQAPVLDIVGAGRQGGIFQQGTAGGCGDLVMGIKGLDGPALLDGFNDVHGNSGVSG